MKGPKVFLLLVILVLVAEVFLATPARAEILTQVDTTEEWGTILVWDGTSEGAMFYDFISDPAPVYYLEERKIVFTDLFGLEAVIHVDENEEAFVTAYDEDLCLKTGRLIFPAPWSEMDDTNIVDVRAFPRQYIVEPYEVLWHVAIKAGITQFSEVSASPYRHHPVGWFLAPVVYLPGYAEIGNCWWIASDRG